MTMIFFKFMGIMGKKSLWAKKNIITFDLYGQKKIFAQKENLWANKNIITVDFYGQKKIFYGQKKISPR